MRALADWFLRPKPQALNLVCLLRCPGPLLVTTNRVVRALMVLSET